MAAAQWGLVRSASTWDDRPNSKGNLHLRSKNVEATALALRGAYLTWYPGSVRRNTLGCRLAKIVCRDCRLASFVELLKQPSRDGVTLTGGAFKALRIENMNVASLILDQPAALQNSCHQGDRRSPCADHVA
jgi:hypothetical protein